MHIFTGTNLSYELVQDRRRSFEQAASRRRLLRSARAAAEPEPFHRRPPDPVHVAPVFSVVDTITPEVAAPQHPPAAPVNEPTAARVA